MARKPVGRTRIGLITSAMAVVVAGALPGPATAAPNEATPARTNPVVARHTVTLLTGDVVLLERTADGRQAATVRRPADRASISYQTRVANGHAYVIPSDAIPLLAAGTLDDDLFDVTQLVADGYDDAHVSSTPLIVEYAPQTQLKAPARRDLPGTSRRFNLESINAEAVRATKSRAAETWRSLVRPAASAGAEGTAGPTAAGTVASGIEKIWLDGKARVSLADSVPQIGAPAAWQAGFDGAGVKVAVLDTGIDATHPDLVGKVVAAANFSTDADALDHHGHGTHVASTVAGTGAASGGARKGVAPGASLINAKVLNAGGFGEFSGIIEGMEWSAAQGATVANMSLSTNAPSDGNDPLVQAVDRISQSTGILFAVAAGNIGPGESTISSPAWANEALTVGAVTKQDVLAGFSARGPRLGDYGVKPDLTAPGVDIVAARAEGTALGPVIDGVYTQISGTSMATPHVAGAVAILAQKYPGYTNRQLKDRLVSTAKPADYSVYEQGSGRVDVARAYAQPVIAEPGSVNLGYFAYPHVDQAPVEKTVTYRNDGTTDVTLDLALTVRGQKTGAATDGMFTVSQPRVTVPAGGTAAVTVRVDPMAGAMDLYGGALTATSGDMVVRTSVGAYVEPEMYEVTVPAITKDARAADGISQVELWGPAIRGFQTKYYRGGVTPTFRVPPGTYSLMGYIFTMDAPNVYALASAVVGQPQVRVDRNMTVTLDARSAKKITMKTPQPSAPLDLQLGYHRSLDGFTFDSSFLLGTPIDEGYAVPGPEVTQGDFEFWSKWTLVAPPIQMTVTKPEKVTLDPLYMVNSPRVNGTHRSEMVYAGFGRPEDYANLDVRGKVALVSRGAGVTFVNKVWYAADAGASAILLFNNVPGLLFVYAGDPGTVPIPGFTIDQEVGLRLVESMKGGTATLDWSGTEISPYEYDLFLPNPKRIADEQTYTIDSRNTARVEVDYYGGAEQVLGTDIRYAIRPWTSFLFGGARPLVRPLHRTEWVSAAPDTWWWHLGWANYPFDGEFDGEPISYRPAEKASESWFKQVLRPGIPAGLTGWEDVGSPAYREGDEFTVHVFPYVDTEHRRGWGFPGDAETKLYQGDRLLGESQYAIGTYPAVPGSAQYRLVSQQTRAGSWWTYSTDISTTWTFTSATPASGRALLPLLQVDYDLPLDLTNRAPDRTAYTFTLGVGHQQGVTGPAITTVKVWASFDDGATWQPVQLLDLGNGKRRVVVPHPKAATGSDAVSLRVNAVDAAGNAIDQTIVRAYGLKPAG